METQINLQLAQQEIIEKFIRNYKKDGKERRTKNYYEKRLKDFQELWDDFKKRHREILVLKFANPDKAKHLEYFTNDIFSVVEEFFVCNYAAIEEKFHEEYLTPQAQEKSDLNETHALNPNQNGGSGIKLPKISLEKFSGDYRKWPAFHDLFTALIHENKSLSPAQKLQYLKLHLIGEPEHLLRHFQVTDNNYTVAWDNLNDRYNNKRVLVNTELRILLSQNMVSQESTQGVKGLLDTTNECLQALCNLEIDVTGWDPIIVYLVVQKLPHETHQLWEQTVCNSKELPSWKTLKEFLESRFRALEAIASKQSSNKDNTGNFIRNRQSTQSFHTAFNTSCIVCQGSHNIRQCPTFSPLPVSEKLNITKSKGLCLNCLGSGHLVRNCPSQNRCYHCKRRHHSLLHEHGNNNASDRGDRQSWRANTADQNPNVKISANSAQASSSQTLSATTPEFTPNQNASISANVNSFSISKFPEHQVLLATALVRVVAP